MIALMILLTGVIISFFLAKTATVGKALELVATLMCYLAIVAFVTMTAASALRSRH